MSLEKEFYLIFCGALMGITFLGEVEEVIVNNNLFSTKFCVSYIWVKLLKLLRSCIFLGWLFVEINFGRT